MIQQNFLLDFLAKAPAASKNNEPKSSKTPDSGSLDNFKNVLDKTMSRPSSPGSIKKNYSNTGKTNGSQENDVEQRGTVKTYRDALENNVKAVKIEKVVAREVNENTGTPVENTEDTKKEVSKGEAIVNSLAQVLGIKAEELVKILNSLNINPEDLADDSKIQDVVDKLSAGLGLNTQQKQTLSQLVDIINGFTEKAGKNSDAARPVITSGQETKENNVKKTVQEMDKKDWVKIDHQKIEVVNIDKETIPLSEVAAGLKLKLNEIANKLEQNPQELMSDVLKQIKQALMPDQEKTGSEETSPEKVNSGLKASEKVNTGKQDEVNVKQDSKDQKVDEAKKGESENKSSTGDNKDGQLETAKQYIPVNDTKAQNDPATKVDGIASNQMQKVNDVNEVAKVHKQSITDVPKNEIINQVLEKAKVILSPEKSEMVMDLKPDSLGKLALKVVTENGMVLAKFVAENQQVKEVLESNMQLLKDSLEKQGFFVQGFNVSVGQDSARQFNRNREFGQNSRSEDGIETGGIRGTGTVNIPENLRKMNPYEHNDSRINLTA